MAKASDIFARVYVRYESGEGRHLPEWIAAEMDKLEKWHNDMDDVRNDFSTEHESHKAILEKIIERQTDLQKQCHHEMIRGTAECEPVCKHCGWLEPIANGYDHKGELK